MFLPRSVNQTGASMKGGLAAKNRAYSLIIGIYYLRVGDMIGGTRAILKRLSENHLGGFDRVLIDFGANALLPTY